MSVQLNAYLSFKDNAREAMQFYQKTFGGELKINTFEEYHASEDPSENDKVMHALLTTPNGLTLMAADTPKSMEFKTGSNISMSLSGDDEAQLTDYWQKLTTKGNVVMPLEKAEWGDTFGMLTDQFGINWMVNISPAKS